MSRLQKRGFIIDQNYLTGISFQNWSFGIARFEIVVWKILILLISEL